MKLILTLTAVLFALRNELPAAEKAQFIVPPEVVVHHTPERDFVGPGMCLLENGDILMAAPWGRPPTNFEQLAAKFPVPMLYRSSDGGRTWREQGRMKMAWKLTGMVSDGGTSFLRLRDGRVAVVFNRHVPGLHGGGTPVMASSGDDGQTWTAAKVLVEKDDAFYVMNDRLIQLRSGRLVLPVARKVGQYEGDRDEGLAMLSDDAGATWRLSRGTAGIDAPRGLAEPCVAELSDGRVLMMGRTGRGSLHVAVSADGGETWSKPEATTLESACSSLTLKTLPDGRLIVFYNHATPIKAGAFFPRTPLCYAVSGDGGKTWSPPVIVDDEGVANKDRQNIYPSICFTKEGMLVMWSTHEVDPKGNFVKCDPKIGGGKRAILAMPTKAAPKAAAKPVLEPVQTAASAKPAGDSAVLRVITYNVCEFRAFPNKAGGDKLAVADRIGEELARYQPDLLAFQESPNSVPEAIQRVADRLGMKSILFGSGGCLLTRLPVPESTEGISIAGDAKPEELFPKAKGKFVGRAVLEWGGQKLVVYATHLHPYPDAAASTLRQREITQLVRVMRRDQEAGLSVLVLGDMNHTPDAVEYRQWIDAGFTDSFAAKGSGVAETRLYDGPAKPPVKRIDYIFAAGPVAPKVTEARVLWEGRFRAESAPPERTHALSDHLPLLAVFATKAPEAHGPVKIIFDTDMGNDVDDAGALAVLHKPRPPSSAKGTPSSSRPEKTQPAAADNTVKASQSSIPADRLADTIAVGGMKFSPAKPPPGLALREHLGLVTAAAVDGQLVHRARAGADLFETRATLTPGGDLLLMFPEGKHYNQPKIGKVNDLLAMRSSDRGRTWTTPQPAFRIDYSQHGFVPLIPRGSKRIYAFGTQPIPGKWSTEKGLQENAPIGFRWSDDDGHTWSVVKLIEPANDPGFKGMSVMRMTETDSGAWLIGAHEADWSKRPLQTRQYLLRSEDQGKSWMILPGPRPNGWHAPKFNRMDEGRPISLGGGQVFFMARTPEGHLWSARSADDGKTWTDPAPTPLIHPDAPPMLFLLADGQTLVAFHHNRHAPSQYVGLNGKMEGMKDRSELWVSTSTDQGSTWSKPRFVLANALAPKRNVAWYDHQCSYADVVVDGDNLHLFLPHRWERVLHLRFKASDLNQLPIPE